MRALLRGHDEAARQGFYNVIIAESSNTRCLHVFSGFRDLSLEQLESDINGTSCEDNIPEIDPVRLEEIEQAFEILEELGAQQITQWLQLLKQALTEGRFDTEYERLRAEGLDQFMEAQQLLLGVNDVDAAKDWLRLTLDQLDQELIYIQWLQRLAQREWEHAFRMVALLRDTFRVAIKPHWDRILGLLGGNATFAGERVRFSHAMYFITQSITRLSGLLNLDAVSTAIITFIRFLEWLDSGPRLEQGLGTLFAAAHAAFQGWQVKSFAPVTVAGQTAWVAELTLSYRRALELGALVPMTRIGPDDNPYSLTGIRAVVLGHHCQQCGNLGGLIAGWLRQAMRNYGENFTTTVGGRELNVFIVSFTKENPQGVDQVVKHLMGEFGSTHAVIMVVWIENGQVKWSCVSAGCRALTQGEQEAIAHSFANLISQYPRHAVNSAMMVCGGDLDCMREVLQTLWPECSKGGCQGLGQMSR